ncbi:MAG: signal peptidase I [Natronomonas sp.]
MTPSLPDRSKLGLAANVLVVLVLIAAVAPFVVYAAPQVVGADHGLVVLSGSMEPTMSPGDAVIVKEAPASEIEKQDIITFQRPGSDTPTTHRVAEVQQTEDGVAYVTEGDALEQPDQGLVPHDRVVGEVIFVIPFIGYVIKFASTQLGFLALVLTPMALFVLSELWELAKSIRSPETPSDATTGNEPSTAATATAADSDGETAADDSGGFTLTRSSVQLLLLLVGLYVPYSAYVAYTTREAWSIGVAAATIITFLFCLVVYVAMRGSSGGPTTKTSDSADGVVRRGELPEQASERKRILFDSVESLIQMAIDRDDQVVYDTEENTYYMDQGDALYLHWTEPETDGGTDANKEDAPDTTGTSMEGKAT